jgi:hypothetical protein
MMCVVCCVACCDNIKIDLYHSEREHLLFCDLAKSILSDRTIEKLVKNLLTRPIYRSALWYIYYIMKGSAGLQISSRS